MRINTISSINYAHAEINIRPESFGIGNARLQRQLNGDRWRPDSDGTYTNTIYRTRGTEQSGWQENIHVCLS